MVVPNPSSSAILPSYSYSSLPDAADSDAGAPANRRRVLLLSGLVTIVTLVASVTYIGFVSRWDSELPEAIKHQRPPPLTLPRGVAEGVSTKSHGLRLGVASFPWTNRMLTWQRTSFHFQPKINWMNGPLYYKGWYHFFYQYNPEGAVWGNIVWGHSVSTDLIHWRHLPIAMTYDQWYDSNGVWTGSATLLPNGDLVMLYTGSTNQTVQVQNLAYPADPSDPLLIDWVKYPKNPVLVPPPGIDIHDFRDPTTAWLTSEGKWRITIGSKINKTGISLVYETMDFKNFELLEGVLHAVPGTGMWECVDFYPVSTSGENGLDTSMKGSGVKHVVKASFDDDRNDYYSLGTYDEETAVWHPDDPKLDVGLGLRYDYGKFYASKTFFDVEKKRRVLWGWIPETDSELADIQKGWASLQAVPRTVVFDRKTGSNVLQWPVVEVEKLRTKSWQFSNVVVQPGSVLPLDVGKKTSQLDIMAEFELDQEALNRVNETDEMFSCSTAGGAANRGALGPFGLLVLADESLSEQTPVYFYVAKGAEGKLKTFFCADESRSSKATDVMKPIYGSTVPVLKGEKFSMRILVDHSIVESFAQRGRTCITSRIYPTKAIYEDAKIFLFNNATEANIIASLKIWQMDSAYIHSYPTELIIGTLVVSFVLVVIIVWFHSRFTLKPLSSLFRNSNS
ncbi:acid beta-fructofuranosidase-like isoform X3 [Camellia sinensis]|uniref:acid beta-fructofuranosidase-like isoform X3 n=1 Tax=Camellia sinensis TaxID=4442 RepID=UPI001035DE82|nr:acid beta-fructofuranosidase-like isoform X3 [Camellia sinensis]